MPSIRPHLPFTALRRRRAGRSPQDAAPPDRPGRVPAELPMLVVPPEPRIAWATPPAAAELREELVQLEAERAIAALHGLDADGAYAEDLHAGLAAARAAYTGTAVVELALLRAELGGRLQG